MVADPRIPDYLGRILSADGDAVGTCFQIAKHLLVTAWHVLDDLDVGQIGDRVYFDALAGGLEPRVASVMQVDQLRDLAVLRTEIPLGGVAPGLAMTDTIPPNTAVVVTGVSDVDDPGHDYRFLDAVGSWEGGSSREQDLRLGRLTSRSVTKGMSGGPVRRLSDGFVVGIVSARYNSADGWLRDSVWIARIEDLRPLLAGYQVPTSKSYAGWDYRLEPVRSPVSSNLRSPSHLLDVQREVVPYHPRPQDIDLARWRDSPNVGSSILILHGEGGQGKTRLARRCASLAMDLGWEVLQAAATRSSGTDLNITSSNQALLVIVDYFERWHPEVIEQLVSDLTRAARPKLRVLLVARTGGGTWRPVEAMLDRLVDEVAEPIHLLGYTHDIRERVQAFEEAVSAFQGELKSPQRPLPYPNDERIDRSPLALYMSALAAVCADRDNSPIPKSSDVSSFLLDHERRYWLTAIDTGHRLGGSTREVNKIEKLVFLAILFGPVDGRIEARKMLLESDIVDSNAEADRLLHLHALLYPQLNMSSFLTPLYPDRLAEDFLAECMLKPGFADLARDHLSKSTPEDASVKQNAVAIFSAAAERNTESADAFRDLVTQEPGLYKHTNSKGATYYLHKTSVTLKGGKAQEIYFFAKSKDQVKTKGRPATLPEDRVVKENPRNGFLTISKKT